MKEIYKGNKLFGEKKKKPEQDNDRIEKKKRP